MKTHRFGIRPYARLLSMLGDQLIRDETIALVELIKNGYDADAETVTVSFVGFGPQWEGAENSTIVVHDDGDGMSIETIRDAWMNPATPNKRGSDGAPRVTEGKRRVMQGEKGIGRYAMLKLGYRIRLITRPRESPLENVVEFDLSEFGEEFLGKKKGSEPPFLDDLKFEVKERVPETFTSSVKKEKGGDKPWEHGTRIEISALRSKWEEQKVTAAAKEISKLQSMERILSKEEDEPTSEDFRVDFDKEGERIAAAYEALNDLATLCRERAVFRIREGCFDANALTFRYLLNGKEQKVSFTDERMRALKLYRERFAARAPSCGSFHFSFYIFDLAKDTPLKFQIESKKERQVVMAHRVYLYRDGIRVYPYGDPDDDWLGVDVSRGKTRAGFFFSNDQLVGCVNISKKENPRLRDKTNREGLIEDSEGAAQDLKNVVMTFLNFIYKKEYWRYKERKEKHKTQDRISQNVVARAMEELESRLEKKGDSTASGELSAIRRVYEKERSELTKRAETTEDLAGVGLSVETASHDMMLMLSRTLATLDDLIRRLVHGEEVPRDSLLDDLNKQKGMLTFVESQMKDMQLLFRSSKQRARLLRVKEYLDKIAAWYGRALKRDNIQYDVTEISPAVVAKCTEAVLLQMLINLFDNAIYWLAQKDTGQKRILVTLDGVSQTIVFSDNGPGVHPDDAPHIFDAFYSGKGAEGRGLGLYIARQLLGRYGYTIELVEGKRAGRLPGANFIATFVEQEDEQ